MAIVRVLALVIGPENLTKNTQLEAVIVAPGDGGTACIGDDLRCHDWSLFIVTGDESQVLVICM